MTLAAFYHVHEHECALLSLSLLVGARRRQFARDVRDGLARAEWTRIQEFNKPPREGRESGHYDKFWRDARADYLKVQAEARAEFEKLFTVVN